jgi:hypothetical protein
MATERKPLYITISSIHQFELPTTASAGGLDLNTGKNIYYNTSSLHWETQNAFTFICQFNQSYLIDYVSCKGYIWQIQ